jgi:hypothetical protein
MTERDAAPVLESAENLSTAKSAVHRTVDFTVFPEMEEVGKGFPFQEGGRKRKFSSAWYPVWKCE